MWSVVVGNSLVIGAPLVIGTPLVIDTSLVIGAPLVIDALLVNGAPSGGWCLPTRVQLTALFTKPPYSLPPYRTGSGGCSVWWLPLIF